MSQSPSTSAVPMHAGRKRLCSCGDCSAAAEGPLRTTPPPRACKGQAGRPYSYRNVGHYRAGASRSFTLIEVLTVLVIVGILFTALLSALRGVLTLRENEDARASADIVVQKCLRGLDTDTACIVPPGEGLSKVFSGEMTEDRGFRRDRLEFCTAVNSPRSAAFGSDVVQVVYEVVESQDGASWELVRAVYRNLLSTETEDPEEEVLLTGVRSLEAAYFDGTDWVDSWDAGLQNNAVPRALRIRIELGTEESVDRLVDWCGVVLSQALQQTKGGDAQ